MHRLEHLGETLTELGRYWESRHRAETEAGKGFRRRFTIALSREAGTQGTLVAREVGRRLGWKVYDHELLEQIALDMGLRTMLLESMDERRKNWLTEAFEGVMSASVRNEWQAGVSEIAFVRHLVKTVLALGVHGECVIVGRGASFILPTETTLRVRLVAPLQDRIATLGRNLGVSESEAARRVRTIDRERRDFIQDHFLKDPSEPSHYDLIVNAARLSAVQCAELIVTGLQQLQTTVAATIP